jgi:hypothetical protein
MDKKWKRNAIFLLFLFNLWPRVRSPYFSGKAVLRQAKMGLIDTILHFRLIVLWCRDCPHLA